MSRPTRYRDARGVRSVKKKAPREAGRVDNKGTERRKLASRPRRIWGVKIKTVPARLILAW
jgi:hypothetical protein